MQTDYPVKSTLSKNDARVGKTRGHRVYRAYLGHILMEDERLDLTICVPSSIRNVTGALKRSCIYPVYIRVPSPRGASWISDVHPQGHAFQNSS